jgi:ribosomal protein L7/L12
MAFKVSLDAQLIFFTKLFGPHNPLVQKVKELINHGVKIDVNLYAVKASLPLASGGYEVKQVALSTGSTSLLKGTGDPAVLQQNKQLIAGWIMKLEVPTWHTVPSVEPVPSMDTLKLHLMDLELTGLTPGANHIIAIKALQGLTDMTLKQAKQAIDKAHAGVSKTVITGHTFEWCANAAAALKVVGVKTQVVEPIHVTATMNAPVTEKPLPTVVKLRDAKALGQKVFGTSPGSVYHCVALNPRIRVAARIYKAGAISIRVEWDGPEPSELELLKAAGLSMKKDYASIHFNPEGVPAARCIGAFVLGTGLQWSHAIINGSDLVIEES